MRYFEHVMIHYSLHKTIPRGSLRGKRRRGRPRKDWNSNICKWSGMSQKEVLDDAHNRKKMEKGMRVVVKSCPPYDQQVKGLSK